MAESLNRRKSIFLSHYECMRAREASAEASRDASSTTTVVLGLITQWLNPLREFLAPSFSPQLESAAPLLALRLY